MTDLLIPSSSSPLQVRSRRWRLVFDWSATSVPVTMLLLVGMAAGPHGINLLTTDALSFLDPAMPVAIGSLGVLAGLAMGPRRPDSRRLLAAAWLGVAITMFVVAAGFGAAAMFGLSFAGESTVPLLVTLGICASTSLTLHAGDLLQPRSVVARVVELEVLLPVVAGGLLLAALRAQSASATAVLIIESCAVTAALAGAVWLLLTRVTSETEERVLVVSALLLVGGVAGALALSSLFGGLVAGLCWLYAGKRPRESIRRNTMFVQHPLLVLVLLVAGARTVLSPASLMLGGGYLALRMVGRLAGGAAAGRGLGAGAPSGLGLSLLWPGVFGVAFALDAAITEGRGLLLSAVVVGTTLSEVVAILVNPRKADE